MTSLAMRLLERDLVPDFLIRRRIRALLAGRLREEDQRDPEEIGRASCRERVYHPV